VKRIIDLTGQKFGLLLVISQAEDKHRNTMWLCKCDCGNETITRGQSLRIGKAQSCGHCLTAHKMHGTDIYNLWANMLQRCRNPKSYSYKYYGARGITVCERWLKFDNFYADMWPRPDGMSLDRIDNDGIYEPSNCRWATAAEQARNNRNARKITFNGKTQVLTDWAKEIGLSHACLRYRLTKLPVEIAFTAPWQRGIQLTALNALEVRSEV